MSKREQDELTQYWERMQWTVCQLWTAALQAEINDILGGKS